MTANFGEWLERAHLLLGDSRLEKLQRANVLVVGLGGVGSFAAEFLARAGVGKMTIVDGDSVDITNINRQMQALHSTIGQAKVQLTKQRLLDINPNLELVAIEEFLEPERMKSLLETSDFDYVVDAIDSMQPKIQLIVQTLAQKIPLVSAMGAGGVLNPAMVKVADISKTYHCKLAKHVKKRLKREKIKKGFKAVFSAEQADENSLQMTDGKNYKKSFYGTISYMPAIFGIFCAGTVIQDLIK